MTVQERNTPKLPLDLVSSDPAAPSRAALAMERVAQWFRSSEPYLMLLGFALFIALWALTVDVWKLPRFSNLPGPAAVINEWFSPRPTFGLSVYTPDYYLHILTSLRRVLIAFALATAIGVPLGLMIGWSQKVREYVFPVFELLRPIPALAWVPLSILMFKSTEAPVIYITFLPAFFATTLNTVLGVESIDNSYFRAAACLGARPWQTFRHVVVPGALPFIFTGLQISMGVAWFSLVAGEMISGEYGLGYVIYTAYTMVSYPTIVIGMITLGIVGYLSSAAIRLLGNLLMRWRVRELGVEPGLAIPSRPPEQRPLARAAISVALFLLCWEIAARSPQLFGVHIPVIGAVPAPSRVLTAWTALIGDFGYWQSWYLSTLRVLGGFGVAMLIGIPLGLLLALSRPIYQIVFPTFEVLRPIPPLAWVPASILFWPTQELSIGFITFLGAFYTVVINVIGGARDIDRRYMQAAYAMGSTRKNVFFRIMLAATLPSIVVGAAVGMGITWEVVVAAEMISGGGSSMGGAGMSGGVGGGLGFFIWNSYTGGSYEQIIVGMISIGIAGYISSSVIRLAGRLATPWLASG
jgi:NitT/TauT family transport system permease protein